MTSPDSPLPYPAEAIARLREAIALFSARVSSEFTSIVVGNTTLGDLAALLDYAERAGEAMRWRPIEEAPKDGTRMLLAKIVGHPANPTALWWAVTGHWSDKWKNWNDGVEPCGLAGPTHFAPLLPMPLPPAPDSEAKR